MAFPPMPSPPMAAPPMASPPMASPPTASPPLASRHNQPYILMCSTPVSGHIIPMLAIAAQLVARNYDVGFVTGSGYRRQVESAGALFFPVEGYGDFHDLTSWDLDPEYRYHHSTRLSRGLLRTVSARHPHRPIFLLTESLNFAASAIKLGAPGLRPDGFIAIGLNPILLTSIDHSPFGSGMLPDRTAEGRERNRLANAAQKQLFAASQAAYVEALVSVGATAKVDDGFLLDSLYTLPDRFIQMCTPSVEYCRSDAPDTLRFAGRYPTAPVSTSVWERPRWWDEVTARKTGTEKKTVFVCQGTVAMDFNQLVIPTMMALKDRSDLLVLLSLGRPNTALSADVPVPRNSRVVDFIPYDGVLPHVDVFVTTGGYGSFQRALNNGTPLVIAGTTEEKPETAARAEWAGVAVNLRTAYPSIEQLGRAVDEVLTNGRYKARALQIRAEMATYDPVGVIVASIEELAGRRGVSQV